MAGLLGALAGAVIGGMLLTSLFAWIARRLLRAPLGGSFFFALAGCYLLSAWGFAGGGVSAWHLLFAWVGYTIGAVLSYTLARRTQRTTDDVADFE